MKLKKKKQKSYLFYLSIGNFNIDVDIKERRIIRKMHKEKKLDGEITDDQKRQIFLRAGFF